MDSNSKKKAKNLPNVRGIHEISIKPKQMTQKIRPNETTEDKKNISFGKQITLGLQKKVLYKEKIYKKKALRNKLF